MDQDIPFDRIGGYRVLRRLATGGTSDVLLARAEGPHGFERTVVLKLLLQQFRRDPPMEKMFAREAAAYARLSHPAIVKLYDFFSAEAQLVMVLEYIDGLPLNRLRAMLRKNGEQLDDRASIFVASRVFAALAAAHGARDPESGEFAPVIHRDVNPSNVLIPWDGHVKLADFGIAKVAGVTSDTQAGFIKGTYGYMAPEQVRGDPVTVRTDVYAASLLLWELLARRKAIQRGALPELEVLRAMAEPSLPSLDVLRPDLPQRLRDAVGKGLEASPDSRSVTAEEMLIVLRESVTSNEGRNVLAETLARVRPEADRRSAPPQPAGTPSPISPDTTSKVPALSPPRPPGRAQSDGSIDLVARTALGTGQVQAVATENQLTAVTTQIPAAQMQAQAQEATSPAPVDVAGVGGASGSLRPVEVAGVGGASGSLRPITQVTAAAPVPPPEPPRHTPPSVRRGPAIRPIGGTSTAMGIGPSAPLAASSANGPVAAVPPIAPRIAQAPGVVPRPGAGATTVSGVGAYSAVASGGRPLSEERTSNVAPPPPALGGTIIGGIVPVRLPAPPAPPTVTSSATTVRQLPSLVSTSDVPDTTPEAPPANATLNASVGGAEGSWHSNADSIPPAATNGTASNGEAEHAPLPPPPPPPMAMVPPPPPPAAFGSTLVMQTPQTVPFGMPVGAMAAPGPGFAPPPTPPAHFFSPPQKPSPAPRQSPAPSPLADTLASERSAPTLPPAGRLPKELYLGDGTQKPAAGGRTYTLIAGIALVASAAVVAALLFARHSTPPPSTKPIASASALFPPPAPAATSMAPVSSAPVATSATATATVTAATSTTTAPAAPSESAAPPASAVATAPPPAASAPATAPAATAAPAGSSTEGDIVTPANVGSHRVFVDGHYAGDSPGPVRVKCGTHTVKIGSAGVPHSVEVPCGGEVSVSPR